jgi:hypothetical protein
LKSFLLFAAQFVRQDDWNESDPGSRAERHLADGVESRVPRTTKLYDRTGDEITLDEVERIKI